MLVFRATLIHLTHLVGSADPSVPAATLEYVIHSREIFIDVAGAIGHMGVVGTQLEEGLERRCGTAFLVGGAFLLASPAAKGLALLTDVSPQIWLIALLVFSGLTSSLVALLGLYPRLSAKTPRLSLAGVVATVLAGAVTLGTFAWMMGTHLLPYVPGVRGLPAPPAGVFVALVFSLFTAFTLFGLASLWSAVPSRKVGGLLLALPSPWIALIVAKSVFASLPLWLSVVTYGLIPMVMLALGHHLRSKSMPRGHGTSSSEPIMA